MNCPYCRESVDPTDRHSYQRVSGWERKSLDASRRGGSDITLREHQPEWAHSHCVENAKLGINAQQGALAL